MEVFAKTKNSVVWRGFVVNEGTSKSNGNSPATKGKYWKKYTCYPVINKSLRFMQNKLGKTFFYFRLIVLQSFTKKNSFLLITPLRIKI